MAVNLKAAKALGLTVPQSILPRRRGDRITAPDTIEDRDCSAPGSAFVMNAPLHDLFWPHVAIGSVASFRAAHRDGSLAPTTGPAEDHSLHLA
jgi:hypothetical protein